MWAPKTAKVVKPFLVWSPCWHWGPEKAQYVAIAPTCVKSWYHSLNDVGLVLF